MIYMLHISDLHFVKNAASYNTEEILCQEAKDKVGDVPKGQKLLIVTGDFHTFSDRDYIKAEAFLTRLVKDMGLDISKDVFVIPGNHDVGNDDILEPLLAKEDAEWKLHKKAAVAMLKSGDMNFIPERLRAFRAYNEFVKKLGIYHKAKALDAPAATHIRTWNGKKRLNILHLNTALIADGKTKNNQMTDTDTAANAETWKKLDTVNIPAIVIAHNSYYDLKAKQRKELATAFKIWNIRAYLCGDKHRTEKDPEHQIIRLESGHRSGKEIPNLVAARSIADGNDTYSEVGFCWHAWDEDSSKVTVEFRKWTPDNLAKTVPDGEPGEYCLSCAKPTHPKTPSKETPSVNLSETVSDAEMKDPDADLKAYLNETLIQTRNDHPSFQLMKIDDLDTRLFPAIAGKEMEHFPIRGSMDGKGKVSPVWDLIEETWKAPENHSVVIEGKGGIGKTVTLFSVAEQEDGHPKKPALYIPLFDLVDESGKSLNLNQYLNNRFPQAKAETIRNLAARRWQGPSLLLLLDGFNEIPATNRYEILTMLRDWRKYHPGAQFIAVSRKLEGMDLAQSLEEGSVFIQLTPLKKETVQAYVRERMPERMLPSEQSKIWDFLIYPLFLILYLKTGLLERKTAFGYDLFPKHNDGPGGIIWNYLQRELLKIPSEDWVIRCAVACEFILPRIAYDMVNRNRFTVGRQELCETIRKTWEALNPETLPVHLGNLYETYRNRHSNSVPDLEIIDWVETVFHETGLLSEYQEHRKTAGGKKPEMGYTFIHQHFRDCLAGIYLVNQGEMAGENDLPEVWQRGQSHLALHYAAELMDGETADKLWETNRRKQQYNQPGYEQNHTATCALLELEKRRNPKPQALDFSGMDLQGLSLARYMGQFRKDLVLENEADRDGSVLPLFRKAALTQNTLLDRFTFQSEGHSDSVTCIALIPDGRVVSGSNDSTVRVWDAVTGQCLQTLRGHEDIITCVAVFPDGRVVSGSDDRILRMWDVTTGKCMQTLQGHKSGISCVTVLPDGQVVSGAWDNTLRVWDGSTGQCLQTFQGHKSGISCVAVLPDGVVSGSRDNTLRVWDGSTGQCLQTFQGHERGITCVAVLSNGRVVSGSYDSTLRVWDPASGQCLQTLQGHELPITCVSVLPNGRVISGSDDGTLRVWDPASGQCLQTLQGHERGITCVSVLPDGRVVSGLWDNTLRVWDGSTGQCLQTLQGHERGITCVSVLPDGQVISGSDDSTLRVWDAATGSCLQTLKGHEYGISCVAVLPDGRVVRASYDNTLRAGMDPASGQCLHTLEGYKGSIYCVSVLPDGCVVSGLCDNTLRVWDGSTGQCLQTLQEHERGITCVSLLPDGRMVSGSDDSTLRVWVAATGSCLQTLKGHEYGITCVAILPEGRVISGSWDRTIRVWDGSTGQCLQTLQGHEKRITCVAVLPEGRVVSGSSDCTLRVWNAASGQCLQTLRGHEGRITCVAVLPDGRVVSGSADRTLRVWDGLTGQCLQKLQGHEAWITRVAVLPNGRVASGSADRTLRVWDATSGQCLQTLKGYKGGINYVAVLPDGRVVIGSHDDPLQVWDPNTGKCLDVLEAAEVDVSEMDFSQARLTEDLAKLLWNNGATISQADYENWVKPSRSS